MCSMKQLPGFDSWPSSHTWLSSISEIIGLGTVSYYRLCVIEYRTMNDSQ